MLEQTEKALYVLTELYGTPSSFAKPKEGFNREAFLGEWDKALGDYSAEQVEEACRRVFKFRKAASFPSLQHVLAELDGQEKKALIWRNLAAQSEMDVSVSYSPINDLLDRRCRAVCNGINGVPVLAHDFDNAFRAAIVEAEMIAPNGKSKSTGELFRLACANWGVGEFWAKVDGHLERIVAERRAA